MKNEEAKFVLHAYRPSGADAGDPTFDAALKQMRQDPALTRWFEVQQAFDRAVGAKLQEVAPPAGLRAAILAGANVSREARGDRSWWRRPLPMALAASVAIILALSITFWPTPVSAQEIAAFAIQDTLHERHEGDHGASAAEFQSLLGQADRRLGQGIALDFAALRNHGCRTVRFQGRELLEVCFSRNGKWFHCYVARAEDFPALARRLAPVFTEKSDASAAAWSDGTHLFVVASKEGRAAIAALI